MTLIASVLNDGDERDPISDAARSLLDGHVALSPALAQAGRFPAIDVLGSASRTMALVAGSAQQRAAEGIRRAIAVLDRIEDARRLGIDPVDPYARRVVAAEEHLENFLRQTCRPVELVATLRATTGIAAALEEPSQGR